jgi:hypothetical protein
MSPFHQTQFHFGVGWVPVLIECYGMGLVLATILWWAISLRAMGGSFARWKCVFVAAMVAVVTGVTYRANVEVATCLNAPWGTQHYREQSALHGGYSDQNRRLLESALGSGLMEAVPERSVVLLANEYAIWHTPLNSIYFFAAYASKVFITEVPSAQVPASKCQEIFLGFLGEHSLTPRPGRAYRLRDVCLSRKSGYVVLWPADPGASGQCGEADDGEFRLFVRHPRLFQDAGSPAFRVVVDPRAGAEKVERPGKDLAVIRSGRDWGLYSLRSGTGSVDPQALRVIFDGP